MAARSMSPVFAGRAAELARLEARLGEALDGEPGLVVLGGEAGVGKSRLVSELAGVARARGGVVLVGGCVDLGGDGHPFGPFVGALRGLVRERGGDAVADLAGAGRAELAALVPELAAPGVAPVGEPARGRLYEAVVDLLERLAVRSPLLLVLEDLHWADRSTRDLVAFLARGLVGSRVLVVATYRSDDLHRGHPLRPFLAELDRLRAVDRLELDRLDRLGVAQQLAGILGEPPRAAVVDEVFGRSEGNPFFVEELSSCAEAGVLPATLRDLLLARVDRLSPDVQRVLRTAAAVGARVPYPLLAALVELEEPELVAALREAVAHNVLVADPDGDELLFRHSLLREAVHDDLLPGEHTGLHARIAQVLTADPDLVPDGRWPAEVAHHWWAAHDLARALPAAFAAAQAAGRSHAYAEQLRLLERVLSIWDAVPDAGTSIGVDQLDVLLDASSAAVLAGSERAMPLIDSAVALAVRTGDPVRAAVALALRGRFCHHDGRDGEPDLREALRLLGPDGPPAHRARVLDALALHLTLRGATAEAEPLAREALDLAVRAGATDVRASAQTATGILAVAAGDVDGGLRDIREALDIARREAGPFEVTRVLTSLSHNLCSLGRHAESAEAARLGVATAQANGLARTKGATLVGNLAEPLLALGRVDEAERIVEDALALDLPGTNAGFLLRLRGQVRLLRGDLDGAEADVTAARFRARQSGLDQDVLPLLVLDTSLDLARRDPERAVRRLLDLLRAEPAGLAATGEPRYVWPVLGVAALAVADLAQRGRDLHEAAPRPLVVETADAVAARAEGLPAVGVLAAAWQRQVRADLARAAGTDGAGDWAEVLAAWRRVGEPVPTAEALLRVAEGAAVAGDRGEAARCLREAAALADEVGATILAGRVEELARRARVELGAASGAAPTAEAEHAAPEDPLTRLGLTPREAEVLRGVAEGLSNRQIGERLFISTKTASVHVSNILAKLGVTGRGEAAAVAHRLRLFDADAATVAREAG